MPRRTADLLVRPLPNGLAVENEKFHISTSGNSVIDDLVWLNIKKRFSSSTFTTIWDITLNGAKLTVVVLRYNCRVEAEESETAQTTEWLKLCDAGWTCHPVFKSCVPGRRINLPVGRAGTKKSEDSSDGVQTSSCAILLATVAYFLM
eukprot:GEMP01113289.1.p2 GENE.GEMP01113289.1~~GEMP01113289.1.p2  ORF type:complete len:148 (+),score=16.63 GEMP01113289.1:222-665(+)